MHEIVGGGDCVGYWRLMKDWEEKKEAALGSCLAAVGSRLSVVSDWWKFWKDKGRWRWGRAWQRWGVISDWRKIKKMALDLAAAVMRSSVMKLLMKIEKKTERWCWGLPHHNEKETVCDKAFDNNYLCTYDLYSPVHNVLDACISITRESGRGLGPGSWGLFGLCEMASSW